LSKLKTWHIYYLKLSALNESANFLKEYKIYLKNFKYDIWTSYTGGRWVEFGWVGPCIKKLIMDRIIYGSVYIEQINMVDSTYW